MSNKEMTTEKRLKVRLYLSLLVYTVVGYGLTLILDYIFSKFDNGIFAWLYWRLDLLFILYLMLGFICIFNYYWKKPWGYLDEVIDATQTVYEQNNHTVSLSEPLKELEEQLNQIKMSVLLSKQAAKQAEEKKNEIIMYQVLLNGMYTALYAEHLLKRAHKAIQKWSAKNVAVHWRYL